MGFNYKIAVVVPAERDDFYVDTVLDGLTELQKENQGLEFHYGDHYPRSDNPVYPTPKGFSNTARMPREKLLSFAKDADLIILGYGKYGIDYDFVERINGWHKTVFVDGSEIGKNKWRDLTVQLEVIHGTYEGLGAPNKKMQKLCRAYFRREKPYTDGMIPFPLGIESRYATYYDPKKEKDIDFVCMFGQEEFPLTRKYAGELVEKFCKKNGFTCHTKKTRKYPIGRGPLSQEKYLKILARAKVGIATGAAGYDSRRFWEILGNNCLVIAERFDLFEPDSDAMNYKRIFQYNNLYDFEYQLEKVGEFLRNGYDQKALEVEYQEILKRHSSKARVMTIIEEAKRVGLLA